MISIDLRKYPHGGTTYTFPYVNMGTIDCERVPNKYVLTADHFYIHIPANRQKLTTLENYIVPTKVKNATKKGYVDVDFVQRHDNLIATSFTLHDIIKLICQDYQQMFEDYIKRQPEIFSNGIDTNAISVAQEYVLQEIKVIKRRNSHYIYFDFDH
jgi:hypothetical protein